MRSKQRGCILLIAYFFILVMVVLLTATPSMAQDLEDKDCGDFQSVVQAQGTFLAAQQITDQRDYHSLDRDANGIACEAITVVKRKEYTDTSGTVTHWVNFRAEPYVINCPTTNSFRFSSYVAQSRRAIQDTVLYNDKNGIWNRMECLHTLGIIEQSR